MAKQTQTAIITETLVADVTTQTAGDTLRLDMGLGARLHSLRRKDIWLFRLKLSDREAALALTRKLAEQTKLFVNPNKHRFSVAVFPLEVTPPKPVRDEQGRYHFSFVVRNHEDTRGGVALDSLRRLYRMGDEIDSVDVGTLWEMVLATDSERSADELFQSTLIARKAGVGMFVNPHGQMVMFPAVA